MIICPSQSPKKEGNNVVIGLAKEGLLRHLKMRLTGRPSYPVTQHFKVFNILL
jgi:hypothetical protein